MSVQENCAQPWDVLAPPLQQIVAFPHDERRSLFVHGLAGTGKTTALQERLLSLLSAGVLSSSVLTILSQPGAADQYRQQLMRGGLGPYSDLQLVTFTGLARRLVALFWPLIAGPAGFAAPHLPPTFLSYELAQVQMDRVIAPMRAEGAFEGLRLRRQQLLSQLLDNVNRAALNQLSLTEVEERLVSTWTGDPGRVVTLRQAADAARRFRQACLDSNLLDVSLVVDVFQRHLMGHSVFGNYITERYRHLLVDNVEEMPPAGIAFVRYVLPGRESAVVAYDDLGGYRRFLAADPDGAWSLRGDCDEILGLTANMVAAPSTAALGAFAYRRLTGREEVDATKAAGAVRCVIGPRYRREMIRKIVEELGRLETGTVAILAPYLDQAASFALSSELGAAGLPHRIVRRRGNPRDEPLVRAWLTLASLAHPEWRLYPTENDVAEGLMLAVSGLDWPRAMLAAQTLYDRAGAALRRGDTLTESQALRIGPPVVADIGFLAGWLADWGGTRPLEDFFRELFNEVWGKVRSADRRDGLAEREAAVCSWLADKARRFRQAAPAMGLLESTEQARAFVSSIYEGLVSGDPLPDDGCVGVNGRDKPSILITTIYAFLLSGHAVDTQVWMDGGSTGWWDIPRQPLSNAFVLTPGWPPTQPWTEGDSLAMRNELLARIVHGLCMRCRRAVVLASSDLDERGERQDGPLWRVFAPVIDAFHIKSAQLDKGIGVW